MYLSVNALFVVDPPGLHSSKMGGLSFGALSSNYIGYYADIKTLFRMSRSKQQVKKPKTDPYNLARSFRDEDYREMVKQIRKAWDSFIAEHPKWSNCCDRLNKFCWDQLLYYVESDGRSDYSLIFGLQTTRHMKESNDITDSEAEGETEDEGEDETETETEIGTEAESDTKTINTVSDSEKIPEFGICEETGVVSVTPSFPPNCRKILIEFLTEIKFKIHGEGIENEEDVKKIKEGFRRDIMKHLKFGVTGGIDYDD